MLSSSNNRSFEDQLKSRLLKAVLEGQENAKLMVPKEVNEYISSFLNDDDIKACIALIEENVDILMSMAGTNVTVARKAVTELLAQFPNTNNKTLYQ